MIIIESKFIKSAVKPVDYHPTTYYEIAVVGKSNVGKSSLINTLLSRKSIAKVSSTPGKTRLINFFEVKVQRESDQNQDKEIGYFSLADLPGYGFAKVSKNEKEKWERMVNDYFQQRNVLKAIFLLVDIRHQADPKDLAMLELLKYHQIPFVIVATKSDKIPKNKVESSIRKLVEEFKIDRQGALAFSSLKKQGLPNLLSLIEEIVFFKDES